MSGEQPEPQQEPAVDEAGAIELQEIAPEGEELEGMLTGDSNTEEVPTGWPFLRTNFFPADTLRS